MAVSISTFLRQTLAFVLVEHSGRLPLDRLVAVRLRARNLERLAVHLKAVHLLHSVQAGLLAIEHDEGLALALQAALSDDIEDGAIVFEHDGERLLQRLDLDALLEVVDLRH